MAERLRPKSQELTPAELEIMQILWTRGKGFVNDVIEHLLEPKPAYNTVSTVLRVLEKKGFVGYKAYGKSHEYYPLVDRDSYTSTFMSSVLDRFFGGSTSRMVSFLTSSKAISLEETSEIIEMLRSPEKDSVAAE